jgi:hypothetical protein
MSRRTGLTKAYLLALVLAGVLGVAASATAATQAPVCDRACLSGLLNQYIDSLVAHDAARLPLTAATVRYTEDSKDAQLGEGLWRTVTGKGSFRHDYLDVARQKAATHVQLLEGAPPVLYSVVLHVQGGRIGGIETLVQRVTPDSRLKPTELGQPVRGLEDPVPSGKRQSRAAMVRTALLYTEGLRIGSFVDAGTPFAADAYRVENAAILAGPGCNRPNHCGLYEQNIILHPAVSASVAAVDEEKGVVLLWMNFGYTGPAYGEGNALVTFEAFKVWGGQIRAINAFFTGLPLSTSRWWSTTDPVHGPVSVP